MRLHQQQEAWWELMQEVSAGLRCGWLVWAWVWAGGCGNSEMLRSMIVAIQSWQPMRAGGHCVRVMWGSGVRVAQSCEGWRHIFRRSVLG